jgi:uncharacterized membrane protein
VPTRDQAEATRTNDTATFACVSILFDLAALFALVIGQTLVSLTSRILGRRPCDTEIYRVARAAEPKSHPLVVKQRLPV